MAGRNVTISVDSTILMPNPPSPADTPDNHTLLFYRTGDTDRSKTCENDCSISNDFTYDPNPNHPNVTVTPDTTAPLKPGDTIHYTLTTSNPYDANQNGVSIENFFPLNLDPSTVVIDGQANLTRDTGNGDPGGGWVIGPDTGSSGSVNNVNGPCAGTFNYFGYGMLFAPQNPAPSWFRCGYTAASGSSQPRSIYIYLGTMPAYSKITLSFYGKVKAADKVGVYPGYVAGVNSGDTRYCAGSDDYGSTGILTGCEDFSGGYQGVANFAGASTTQSTSNQWPAPALAPRRFGNTSNINYNPIPGAITCVSKATNGPFEDTDFSSTMSPCDGGAAQKDHYGYAANSNYNHATMTMQAARDTSLGPVDYVLLDQTDSIGIDQAIDPVSSNWHDYTYNPANRNISWGNFGNAATQSHMAGTGGSDINAISLDVQFNSSKSNPTGQTSSNYAQFCIIKYWEPGHGRQCSQTNTLTFRSFQKDSPYLDTASGNVHAGGTGGSLCSNSGTNTNSGTPVIGGGTSIGDYFVTSSGYVGTGSRNLATPGSVGVIYRPDLCAEAQRLGASGPAVSVLGASGSIDGGVNEGQVVTSNANYTLGSGGDVQINKRWTLFINGNLYIKSNVRYGPAQHATTNGVSKETNHPSFGVIVNGNIYIDRNVQNLDGFFVASKVLNTCTSDINGSTVSYQRADGSTAPGTLPVDQCNNKLFVNGSLFANTFRFNRIVPSASGQSEKVTFNNLLFTATPPGFNSLVNSYLISKYLIEPLPRY
ncbi:MAG TPA: hypothetical protein VLF21_00045 [Candidatus Saccharimonadales bacterium]|nr:hypothetical protein [Candidatus Saccharimonadales bacterium]